MKWTKLSVSYTNKDKIQILERGMFQLNIYNLFGKFQVLDANNGMKLIWISRRQYLNAICKALLQE